MATELTTWLPRAEAEQQQEMEVLLMRATSEDSPAPDTPAAAQGRPPSALRAKAPSGGVKGATSSAQQQQQPADVLGGVHCMLPSQCEQLLHQSCNPVGVAVISAR